MSGSSGAPALPFSRPVRVLVDTNVILDGLLNRTPWSVDAQPLWRAQQNQTAILHVSASTITDLFYLVRRLRDISMAFATIDRILGSFEIISVDDSLLRAARALPGNDFEDNVQIACAQSEQLDLIVTRDASGFAHASIPVIAPQDIMRYLPTP